MALTGHDRLMLDLKDLVILAERFEFHDFKNLRFPAPKLELVRRLHTMTEHAMLGRYDNKPTEDN